MSNIRCWNCGNNLDDVPRPISRHEQCQQCFEALHCCRLCLHYRPRAPGHCDEERADPPVVKENANFCEWFNPDSAAYSGQRADKSGAAQDKLGALFGSESTEDAEAPKDEQSTDPDAQSPEQQARDKLDDLFS